jgi:hypothetical protein
LLYFRPKRHNEISSLCPSGKDIITAVDKEINETLMQSIEEMPKCHIDDLFSRPSINKYLWNNLDILFY